MSTSSCFAYFRVRVASQRDWGKLSMEFCKACRERSKQESCKVDGMLGNTAKRLAKSREGGEGEDVC